MLGVSIVGMTSLIALKRWELASGHVLGGRVRPAVGALMHRVLVWGEFVLPGLLRYWISAGYRYVRSLFHRLSALAVVVAEHLLERALRVLRRNTQVPRSDTEASAFLREVSAHKKQLLKNTRKRVIYDD